MVVYYAGNDIVVGLAGVDDGRWILSANAFRLILHESWGIRGAYHHRRRTNITMNNIYIYYSAPCWRILYTLLYYFYYYYHHLFIYLVRVAIVLCFFLFFAFPFLPYSVSRVIGGKSTHRHSTHR